MLVHTNILEHLLNTMFEFGEVQNLRWFRKYKSEQFISKYKLNEMLSQTSMSNVLRLEMATGSEF